MQKLYHLKRSQYIAWVKDNPEFIRSWYHDYTRIHSSDVNSLLLMLNIFLGMQWKSCISYLMRAGCHTGLVALDFLFRLIIFIHGGNVLKWLYFAQQDWCQLFFFFQNRYSLQSSEWDGSSPMLSNSLKEVCPLPLMFIELGKLQLLSCPVKWKRTD